MCEILFRGKRKDTGEWMESPTVLKPDNHMYMCKSSMCEITYDLQYNITAIMSKKPFFVEVIPETVGQYTGLTDRNGNKIFEGDILQCNNNPKDIVKIVFGKFSVIDMETETAVDEIIGWHYEVIPTDAISKTLPFLFTDATDGLLHQSL